MYHLVRDIKASKYSELKGLEFSGFKRQLDYLENNYKIIKTEALFDFIINRKNLPKNACLLTFDDGYKDHTQYVLPELLKRKIQGSFFPSARPVIEKKALDVNFIHFILACCPNYKELINSLNQICIENDITEKELVNYWSKYAIATRYDSKEMRYIKGMLQNLSPNEIRIRIIEKLFKKYVDIEPQKFCEELYMSLDEIKKLVNNGMYVGGHGYSHFRLNEKNQEDQKKEINLTLKFLEEVGAPTKKWIMCYPFGAYNLETISILKQMECCFGLTFKVGINDLNTQNKFELLRFDTNDFPQ
tara:strand:- start:397 stop:1302 length:906 start_codon:yes stop_codon:yes gene_type:complete